MNKTQNPNPTGMLVIDKPSGMTSFDVIRRLRRATGQRKLGHAGTLDPMATGVLLIMFNRATRLAPYLMDSPKCYRAEVSFGAATDTDDAEGTVIARGETEHLEAANIDAALQRFIGAIEQTPPQYSALHVNGKRAYELAREGKEVEIKARVVEIDRIENIEHAREKVRFDVWCGKGTYIRSIARDLGEALGTRAHLSGLRRTYAAHFSIDEAHTLDAIEPENWQAKLCSAFEGMRGFPKAEVTESDALSLVYGQRPESCLALTAGIYRVPIPGSERLLAVLDAPGAGEYPKVKVFAPDWKPASFCQGP